MLKGNVSSCNRNADDGPMSGASGPLLRMNAWKPRERTQHRHPRRRRPGCLAIHLDEAPGHLGSFQQATQDQESVLIFARHRHVDGPGNSRRAAGYRIEDHMGLHP